MIASSILVKPSRILDACVNLFCACVALAGVAVVAGTQGNLDGKTQLSVVAACIICALFALLQWKRLQIAYRIDISSNGEIRVTANGIAELVDLSDKSTLWSFMMLLVLVRENGETCIIRIMPDSVLPIEFKQISVALRWIVARNVGQKAVVTQRFP